MSQSLKSDLSRFVWSESDVVSKDEETTKIRLKGGPGSGHHGHRGRQGKRGGSVPDKGTSSLSPHVQKVMDYVKQRLDETDIMQIMVDNGYKGDLEELESGWNFQQKTVDTLTDCAVCIRVNEDVLDYILADGKFKNQFESGRSNGYLGRELRSRVENQYFGIDEDNTPDDQRPIYGYVADTLDALESNLSHYGEVVITLKDTVRDRTTITGFDSLNKEGRGVPASPLNDPNWKSMVDFNYENYKDRANINAGEPSNNDRAEYIEAQIHGGVSVDDIDTIYFYPPYYMDRIAAGVRSDGWKRKQTEILNKFPNINVVVFEDTLQAVGYDIYK